MSKMNTGTSNVLLCFAVIWMQVLSCSSFYLQIDKDLPFGAEIFDLSFTVSQNSAAEYILVSDEANQASKTLFSIAKHHGILYYKPMRDEFASASGNITKRKFSFDVQVDFKHLHYLVPFEISFNKPVFNSKHGLRHSMQVTYKKKTIAHLMHANFKKCPSQVLPRSICSCSLSTSRNVFRKQNLQMKQFISHCNIPNSFLPTQQLDVKVKVFQKDDAIHRHKRSSRQGLYFTQTTNTLHVLENKPKNTLVGKIQAYENNRVAEGVSYELEAMKNIQSLNKFRIDQAGAIYTKTILDRETFSRHQFRVTASRFNSNQARTVLIIIVGDENDNPPEFAQPDGYQIQIEENQPQDALVFRVNAFDSDDGANGQINYTIINFTPSYGSRVFAITQDGDLVVKGVLDREKYPQYNLTIKAQDNGSSALFSTIHVVVNVDDQNDNWPQFTKAQYVVRVKEGIRVGSVIGTVSAYDGDAGRNGEVTYSLIQGNRMRKFRLNSQTGEVSIRESLDYEEAYLKSHAKYTLAIRASDGGRPPHSNSSGIMDIYVLDDNDNTPQFYLPTYHFDVQESARINSLVGRVEAYDQDGGENARITYSIVQQPLQSDYKMFRIDEASGSVRIAKKLDYETKKQYEFSVKASDNGQSKRFVQTKVYVIVHDVNDNAPQFTKTQYEMRIAEDTNVGDDEILVVNATDPDETSVGITYQIVAGDLAKKFSIVTRNNAGIIKLSKHLDYNEQQFYRLIVKASDGSLSNTTVVSITITDTNSHKPVFDKAVYGDILIKEDIRVGSYVVQVHANDEDVGENARITYCFLDSGRDFVINASSGVIRTNAALDYEKSPMIKLTVQARDNGIPSKYENTEVIIYLQDTNDNPPQFKQSVYRANISEDSTRFTEVLRISATDKDTGRNARIQYTFDNGNDGNGDFLIDLRSGTIRTARKLDRESISQYRLVAYAVDGGQPASSTAVTVVVNVLDVDDNPPSFENDTLVYRVKEDVAVGQVIAQIQAKDPDLQSTSIKYDLGHNPLLLRQWFLDPWTGELKALHKLDYETKRSYEFTVTASSNNLVNQAVVKIFVEDCNDNSPVFNDFEIIFNNYRTRTRRSFPYGVIGKVPAHDPDVSDKLLYKFLSGNADDLLLLNETTGEIRLNPSLDSNRQFTATMLMEVTDGIHPTRANCVLKVTGISDVMLQHSITVRVQHMNDVSFLSPSVMNQFTDGLAHILNTSTSNVIVFNVQNDTDVHGEVLNVSFSARKDPKTLYSSKYLQNEVYLNRQTLAKRTGRNVLPFDDNICLREPCLNYKRCTSVLTFDSSASFISSPSVIFRPIRPVNKLKCECPIGFTNDQTCEDEVDMCYSSPCQNGGTCVPNEGAYTCVCRPRFTGANCEINFDSALCTQHPDVCVNGGTCRDEANHISCDCDASMAAQGQVSETCELLSRQFAPGNFLMLPGITKQWHFSLSISFVTLERDGLLFYNGRLNHQHDFMALEVVGGQVQLNFSTGSDSAVVKPHVNGGVNDGQWHTVQLKYFNEPKPGPLPQGVLNRLGPSSSKLVTVTVDPSTCDDVIASHWNPTYGNYSCSKQVKQTSPKKSLDLTSPLLLGGVPDLPEDYQVRSKSFTGCLGSLKIDEKLFDLASFIANNGSKPGCPAMLPQCASNQCLGHGVCSPKWNGYECGCDNAFTGQRCEESTKFVVDVSGGGCLRYSSPNRIPIFRLPWHTQLSFRTFDSDAVLLHITLGRPLTLQLVVKISQRKLVCEATLSGITKVLQPETNFVNDGRWHRIDVDLTSLPSSRVEVKLTLDYDLTERKQFIIKSLRQMSVNSLHVGGKKTGSSRTILPFTGCLQSVEFSSGSNSNKRVYTLDASHLQGVDGGAYRRGCSAGGCQKHRCPAHSRCVEEWTRYRCECNKGYIGDNCLPICSLSLCRNNGKCRLDNSERGYRCECLKGFRGEFCQLQSDVSCPPGWFGDGICAPCNCSSQFDPVCDSNTGACLCKSHHYKLEGSCLPCDCYSVGATRLDCAANTGQCHCKPLVVGTQCNMCASPQAEVTTSGCKVLYSGKCPRTWQDGILWRRTLYGKDDLQRCPRGSQGIARRTCDMEELWSSADLSNCTSNSFYDVAVSLSDVENGKSLLVANSIPISFNLSAVTKQNEMVYDNDLIYTALMLEKLLLHESKLSGFNLAAATENSYLDNLVETSSWLLSNESLSVWKRIESDSHRRKLSASAPTLLQTWEQYVANMLRNFNQMRYEHLRTTSPNLDVMMTKVAPASVAHDGFSYSHQQAAGEDIRVIFPRNLFQQPLGNATDVPVVGVMVFQHLNEVLPMSFVDDRTFSVPKRPSINSVVASVQLYKNDTSQNLPHRYLKQQPIIITFRINDPQYTGATCVFWNHTSKSGGGWSHAGCQLASSNRSHAECHCFHLTSFALLTDQQTISVASAPHVSVLMGVGVAISFLLLLITLIASLALPGVNSVRALVIRNLCCAIMLADLVFAIGIQQTSSKYGCMAVAVILHFFLLAAFSWLFVDGLHLYRKLSELRDINHGPTRVYYVVGWILPLIITALSVGLDAKEFGNNSFCYISIDKTLIWGFAGPLLLCCCACLVLLIMSVHAFLSSKRVDMKRAELTFEMKASFTCAPVVLTKSFIAVFALNMNVHVYFYFFTLVCILQGVLIFLFNCFFNREIRDAHERYKRRRARRANLNNTTCQQHLLQSFRQGTTPESSSAGGMQRFNNSTSDSIPLSARVKSPMLPPSYHSDSDESCGDTSSDSSMSFGSSSCDEQAEVNTYRNIQNMKMYQSGEASNKLGNGKLPNNGKPKLSVKKKLVIRSISDESE